MCGRYYIEEEDTAEELQRIIDTLNRRYNGNHPAKTKGEIRPNDIVPVIANTPARQSGVFAMKWGYTFPRKMGRSVRWGFPQQMTSSYKRSSA